MEERSRQLLRAQEEQLSVAVCQPEEDQILLAERALVWEKTQRVVSVPGLRAKAPSSLLLPPRPCSPRGEEQAGRGYVGSHLCRQAGSALRAEVEK